MGKGDLNIDIKEPQIVEGEFIDQSNWGEIETTCEIRMDRFHLNKSEVKFDSYVPSLGLNEVLKYETRNGIELYLVNSGSYLGGRANATYFKIKEVVLKERSNKYFASGTVKNMVYFPNELEILGCKAVKKVRKYEINGRPKKEMYFVFQYNDELSQGQIEKYLYSLSVLSCNKLMIMEHSNEEHLQIKALQSSSCNVPYLGSGILFYPIKVQEIEDLVEQVNWKHLHKLFLAYTSYCTTEYWIHQLYRGCSVLEYLVDLYWRNLDMNSFKESLKEPLKKNRRSAKLFGVFLKLDLNPLVYDFLSEVFPEIDFKDGKIPSKFEFFELRDRHIHRGELFLIDSDLNSYRRALTSLNDVIRLLITKVYLITDWQIHGHVHMKTSETEYFVDIRQQLIGFKLD